MNGLSFLNRVLTCFKTFWNATTNQSHSVKFWDFDSVPENCIFNQHYKQFWCDPSPDPHLKITALHWKAEGLGKPSLLLLQENLPGQVFCRISVLHSLFPSSPMTCFEKFSRILIVRSFPITGTNPLASWQFPHTHSEIFVASGDLRQVLTQ